MKKLITAIMMAACLWANAETFYWIHDQSDMARNFGSYQNWGVGTDSSATNPNQLVPGAEDDLCCGNSHSDWNNNFYYNLQDKGWSVRNLVGGRPSDNQFRYWNLYDGSLTFTGNVDNKRWYVTARSGSTFILGPSSSGLFGCETEGVVPGFIAADGGEIDFLGMMTISSIRMIANAGGKIVFNPVWIGGDANTFGTIAQKQEARLTNNGGTIECPNGIYFQGSGPNWDGYFHVYQNSGTMILGGPVKHNSHRCRLQFHLSGGTLHATDNVSFYSEGTDGLYYREMTADATATVEVDEGKTIDFNSVKFGSNTTLTKTSVGTASFTGSAPSVLTVAAGECVLASAFALGTGLSLASGTTLTLGALGISATSISGIDGATVKVSASVGNGILFTSSDSDLVSTVADKLNESSSDLGDFTVTDVGIQYTQKRDPLAFSWVHDHDTSGAYYAFNAAANWAVGTSPTAGNPDALLPGSSDDICYGDPDGWNNTVNMDCAGSAYTVLNLLNGRPADSCFRYWHIRNGSLTFTGNVSNNCWYVETLDNGKLVLGRTSDGRFGYDGESAAVPTFIAGQGGEVDVLGTMRITSIAMTANAGGKIVFDPAWIGGDTKTFGNWTRASNLKNNGGTVECPRGIYFTGESEHWDGYFHVYQNSGTMILGGPVVHNSNHCRLQFHLSGGTLHVTNNVSFYSDGFDALYKREVTENAEVTLIVDEGKLIDFTSVTFGANTTIHKYGKGRVKFGSSRPTVYDQQDGLGIMLLVR